MQGDTEHEIPSVHILNAFDRCKSLARSQGPAQRSSATLWAEVQKDPDSISKLWLGHPNRRWSTFLPHQSTHDLLSTNAKIYLVHGSNDSSEDPASHDYFVATLRANGKSVREELLLNADHGFQTPEMAEGSPDGFSQVFTRVGQWFLADK